MFKNPSLVTRIGISKSIGFIFGLCGFLFIPWLLPEASPTLKWGFFLWYITFGAVIGLFGVMTRIPVLNMPLPWWFRGAWVGLWLNFTITLIAYNTLQSMMTAFFAENSSLSSPFWLVAEGVIVGLIIDFFATRFGGEGLATIEADQ